MIKALNETHPDLVPSVTSATDSADPTAPAKQTPGDEALQRIAKAGKKWKNTLARKVDMEGKYHLLYKQSILT